MNKQQDFYLIIENGDLPVAILEDADQARALEGLPGVRYSYRPISPAEASVFKIDIEEYHNRPR